MPVYVKDTLNPNGPKIDVIELKHREPTKDLEPFLIDEYLKQDLWSMKEAVLLLAGYDLKTDCTLNDNKFSPTGIGRVFYLDGLSSHQLNDNGLVDTLNDECFTAYLKLIEHTRHYDIHTEKKHPKDWIKWAIDKGLSPYWLGYTKNITEWFYNHILKKDVWHELEIKALLNADSSIYDLIRAAIVAKTLIPICTVQISEDGASVYGFKATDIIHWAKLKGYAIPDELKDFNTTSQAVEDMDIGKARKKRKPLIRATTEGLELIDKILEHYKIEYLDELSAHKAWGKIIMGEFVSDSINEIAETKRHIKLSGGDKLTKQIFSEKYRKRFK